MVVLPTNLAELRYLVITERLLKLTVVQVRSLIAPASPLLDCHLLLKTNILCLLLFESEVWGRAPALPVPGTEVCRARLVLHLALLVLNGLRRWFLD